MFEAFGGSSSESVGNDTGQFVGLTWLPEHDRATAKAWAKTLQELADALRNAGRASEIVSKIDLAISVGRDDPTDGLARVRTGVAKLRASKSADAIVDTPALLPKGNLTFEQVAKMWTSGELAKLYPDDVDQKKSVSQDVSRLKRLNKVIGHVLIKDFALADARLAMSKLPSKFRPSNRRQYAQVMRRVLALSVYPLELRLDNPLPRGFLPRVKNDLANKWLYPDEEKQLVACTDIPLVFRLAYGFLARMGFRKSEIVGGEDEETDENGKPNDEAILPLTWEHVDLVRGVVQIVRAKRSLAPRPIPLDEGVWAALDIWRSMHPKAKGTDIVFADDDGNAVSLTTKLLRAHLRLAKITRAELFRRPELRVHDFRATFVTVKLALGWTDHQVRDRTGHTTIGMLDRYRRDARELVKSWRSATSPTSHLCSFQSSTRVVRPP